MSDSLESRVGITFNADLVNTLTNSLATVPFSVNASNSLSFTDGTAASMADKVWASKARALSGSTSETLDLYDLGSVDIGAGAGKDPLGQALALVEIVAIVVVNATTSTGNLSIGGDGTTACFNSIVNGSDDSVIGPIGPGGLFLIARPDNPAFAVADSSNHLLKITSSATLTYDIYVIGRSA